jgi:transposase
MAEEQKALVRLRRRTTELCVLRAFTRGRRHLRQPLREGAYPGMKWDSEAWHAQVAERVAKDYAVEAPPAELGVAP